MCTLFATAFGVLLLWGCAAPASVSAQTEGEAPVRDITGTWQAEENYFRPLILVERDGDGRIVAYLTDVTLTRETPFSEVVVQSDSVLLTLDRLAIEFRGRLAPDDARIEGTYTQGDLSTSLTLIPAVGMSRADRRPQEPQPPYPYASEEVTFESAPGVVLAGTLTVPEGDGPFAGVVLLQGTGLADRDAEVGGHRTFLILADHLTRHGVAVLRYDKRGGGRSTGDTEEAGLDDLTRDAEAALRYVRSRPEVDPTQAGLLGHSEGALVAPRAIGRAGGSFLVLLAPPVAPTGDALVEQNARLAAASGAPDSYVESVRSLMAQVVAAAASDADSSTAALEIQTAFGEQGLSGEMLETTVRAHTSKAFRDLVRYDPSDVLRDVDVPVLAVFGTADLFTPPDENVLLLREAFGGAAAELLEVRVVDGVNHWLQPATTGLPDEIERTDITVSPVVLVLLTEWLREHTSAGE